LKIIHVDPKIVLRYFEMVENKLPFAKGVSIHRSPMFSDVNFMSLYDHFLNQICKVGFEG